MNNIYIYIFECQVLLNFLGRGMSLLDSLVDGRIHTQLLPEVVGVEDQSITCAPDICESEDGSSTVLEIEAGVGVQNALTSRNHDISVNAEAGFAVCQFIGNVSSPLLHAFDMT
jgi:hypothetical protein